MTPPDPPAGSPLSAGSTGAAGSREGSGSTGPVGQAGPPPTPPEAATLFGVHLERIEAFVAILADTGIAHGLVGPREAPRLWDRHVLGCAVLADALRPGESVADIGSGAGLPGLVLAIRRPDLQLTLVEPLHRRVVWLQRTVEDLDLPNVRVHEGRAESLWGREGYDVVTARAVARIGVLAGWCLPLLVPGGRLVALKGRTAQVELDEDLAAVRSAGAVTWSVTRLGEGLVDPPATVVTLEVGPSGAVRPRGSGARRGNRASTAKAAGRGRGPRTS